MGKAIAAFLVSAACAACATACRAEEATRTPGAARPDAGRFAEAVRSFLVRNAGDLAGRRVPVKLGRGQAQEMKLLAATGSGVRVDQSGVAMDVSWEKLGDEGLYRLARPFVESAPAEVHEAWLLLGAALGGSGESGFDELVRSLWRKDPAAARRVEAGLAALPSPAGIPKKEESAPAQRQVAPRQPENIVFPPDAGVVDVKLRFGAKGDGVTDDTAAIQRAIDETKGIPETLYFPDGTYLISDSIGIFNGKAHSRDRFLVYQGQSRARTVIKLKDACPGFGDPARPKIVLSVYEGQGTGDCMHGYVRDLTIDVGRGNPGAIGLRFLSNNTGGIYNVTIRSSDPAGAGSLGLDLRQHQQGPSLIKNVAVVGFDTGVEVADVFYDVIEHLTLEGQRVVGLLNRARCTVRGLKSANAVPAVVNRGHDLTLVEAELSGGTAEGAAIVNESRGRIYLRDARQSGYAHLLRDSSGKTLDAPALDEWYEGKGYSLFQGKPTSLRLPIEETPEVPWEQDLSKWVKVDGRGGDVTAALQEAIDSSAARGATTIYFPRRPKTYTYDRLSGPIRVRGTVNRIIGMENILDINIPAGQVAFTFEDLKSDVLVFERFFLLGGWKCPTSIYMFENRSGKAIVARNMSIAGIGKKASTGGKWFYEDVSTARVAFGPGEKCWARQLNPEHPEADMIEATGAQVWILGLKTEGRATHIAARDGARVELIGGISYQSWANQPKDPPMFLVTNSDASFTYGFYHWNQPFTTIVSETQGGETRTLLRKDLADYHLPLFRAQRQTR